MPETVLCTKLYIPPLRPNLVSRPHLIERLNQGLQQGCKLTLISAPAGFGKTTLVSEWITGGERPAAWLSLDEGDNDLKRFLNYLVVAMQTISANMGEGVLAMLQSPQPPPIESILTALLNEITTILDNFILVLDDYHLIDSSPVDDALAFLLEHLPLQMHLVIATREDPNLPLPRLRAGGQLTELRVTDLRFTLAEASDFLNQVMDLNLSAEELALLETRTEGWIAGLQMAALSMRGREDVPGFIRAFAGDNRYIVDYLIEEVLQRQPKPVRSFLLQTSILDRLSGPLCDAVRFDGAKSPSSSTGTAVIGQEDGRGMLEALERGNLFVVPLDDKRQWYRYHHLFADVLHARLMEEQPDRIPILHQRASEWYEQNDQQAEAIRHAFAAEDFERAAGLIELAHPAMDVNLQSATWLGWAKALPNELVRTRPVLSVGYAWALLDSGELEDCESLLRDAEQWLATTADPDKRLEAPLTEMVVVDEEQFRLLPASIATARAYRALVLGDVPGTVKYAQQALDIFPEENHHWRLAASSLLGGAQYASGDLEAAVRPFAEFRDNMRKAGNIPAAISSTFVLAEIKMTLGRLHEAESIYQQSLQLAVKHGEPMPLGTADLYRGLSELHREWGDLEAASQHLLIAKKLGEQGELLDWRYRLCVAQARLKETQGDLDGALDLLVEAKRWHIRNPIPDVRPIAALKTRLWIKQGRLTKALNLVREQGLSVDDDLSYLREFEHVTLARVLIAQYKNDRVERYIHEAVDLLQRLLKAAEEGGRMGSAIEILVQQALAHEAQGEIPRALAPLERALALAEPEGYIRIFLDEGTPMARLLYDALSQGFAVDYVRQLLAAISTDEPAKADTTSSQAEQSELVEPLSERELEVLQLIAKGLTNQEVATKLFLSLYTVKAHARNIYAKLGVKNRTQAVAKGKALGILSPP